MYPYLDISPPISDQFQHNNNAKEKDLKSPYSLGRTFVLVQIMVVGGGWRVESGGLNLGNFEGDTGVDPRPWHGP